MSIYNILKKKNNNLLFLIYIFISTLFSLMISGHAPNAYLLHVNFFTSFFLILFFEFFNKINLKYVNIIIIIFSITILYVPYKLFFISNILNGKLYRGTTYEIYEYLYKNTNISQDKRLYTYSHTPLHLILNSYPISKYVHPPNIYKKIYLLKIDGTNKVIEVDKIFLNKKLEYIIIEKDLKSFLDMAYDDNKKIDEIDKNFEIVKQINNALIYKKKK